MKPYEVPLSFQVRCTCAHAGCCEAAFSSVRSYKDHSGAVKIEAKFFTHPDRPPTKYMVVFLFKFKDTETAPSTLSRVCVFRKALRQSVQPHYREERTKPLRKCHSGLPPNGYSLPATTGLAPVERWSVASASGIARPSYSDTLETLPLSGYPDFIHRL